MKILIIADIHGNYYALKGVLERVEFHELICAGDLVVDYPFPRECVQLIRKEAAHICMGNNDWTVSHEGVMSGTLSPRYAKYKDAIEKATRLTVHLLDWESRQYLKGLPREKRCVIDGRAFYLNHTVPGLPLNYYLDPNTSAEELEGHYAEINAEVLITAHTHIPYVKKLRGRLLVNPGSVGEPRDGDPRASFAVFDTCTGDVELGRISYDTRQTVVRLKELGFPAYSVYCLKTGTLPENPQNLRGI